ncbi:PREDICTED: ran-specific GTPase-activating protein-like [Priapulus caudatus]|uniref:Ran-specific GTPase-activating protein-like n=1 Tax=Priapulus caudatus TaxID=37621 RepID=A0ABM1EVJ4_PRICU|nr:PREDICTED: ran-specific GTPase-activating protein-like [Priapulus caudatus]
MADDKADHHSHTDEVLSSSPGVHFEPILQLPPVETKTLEEDEEEFFKMRARLYRFDSSMDPPEWKERGTGDVKIMRHKQKTLMRLLMRRDKTYKICANHYISPYMELKQHATSDRAWVWSVPADFADESTKPELLAIRFANVENAQKFKEKFIEAQSLVRYAESGDSGGEDDEDEKDHSAEEKAEKEESEVKKESEVKEATAENEDAEADSVAEKLAGLEVKDQGAGDGDKTEGATEESSAKQE